MLAMTYDAGVMFTCHFFDIQNLIQLGLLSLLVSLIVSFRRDNGLPCFIISGLCLMSAYMALVIRNTPSVPSLDELIYFVPIGATAALFCVTYCIVVVQSGRTTALNPHFGVTLGCVIWLALAINSGRLNAPEVDILTRQIAFAVGGFALVHLLCSIGVYCDASNDQALSDYPNEKGKEPV